MANSHPTTGIPFGYIHTDAIDSEMFDWLTIHNGTDVSYARGLVEHLARKRREFDVAAEELSIKRAETGEDREMDFNHGDEDPEFDEEFETEEFTENYQCDELIYEGEHEGVKYQTSWLGGAQNLWVFESPVITLCMPCSPCVPGAGDLDSVGDYESYGVPADWLTDDFVKKQCEKADFEFTDDGIPSYWRKVGDDSVNGGPFAFAKSCYDDCYSTNLQRKL